MKKFSTTLMLMIVVSILQVNAATYYFSSSTGDDNRTAALAKNQATPWKTLAKLNAIFSTLLPGDKVLLKRGEVFTGTIIVKKSGTAAAPIVISGYGSGSNPVVTSLATLSNWISKGNGVYESAFAISGTTVNLMIMNGQQQEMGRWPNRGTIGDGWNTFESHNTNVSITDNQLTSAINWTGGSVVIRPRRWVIDRNTITSHSGTRISYTHASNYTPYDNYGYFIEDHIKTLDKLGEWFYNKTTKKLSVYFGSNNPSAYKVQVPTIDYVVNLTNYNYVTFDSLDVKGANMSCFNVRGNYLKVTNSNIGFSGEDGIKAFYCTYPLIENNIIDNNNIDGIDFGYGGSDVTVRGNTISNTYQFPGQGGSGDGKGIAIHSNQSNSLFEYNIIRKSGFEGINFNGSNITVKNNVVDTFCYVKDDGGGIYTFGGGGTTIPTVTNRKIIGNIVMNSLGANNGASSPWGDAAQAIYLDNGSMNVDVTANSVFNAGDMGMQLNGPKNVQITGNNIYNANTRHIGIMETSGHPAVSNVNVKDNIFFAKFITEVFVYRSSYTGSVTHFGTVSANYYARPTDAGTAASHTKIKTYDATAKFTDYLATSIVKFVYNATKTAKAIKLDGIYKDVKGTSYSGSITLQPFTSATLIRTGLLTTPPPVVDTAKPTVVVSNPIANQTFTVGATIIVAGTYSIPASIKDTVVKGEYYDNGKLFHTEAFVPFEWPWKTATVGTHAITIKMYMSNGTTVTSPAVSITVKAATAARAALPKQEELTTLKVYPNPATNLVNINVPQAYNSGQITLADMSGRIVKIITAVAGKMTMDITSISSGVYILRISKADQSITTKFVKSY